MACLSVRLSVNWHAISSSVCRSADWHAVLSLTDHLHDDAVKNELLPCCGDEGGNSDW